MVFLPRSVSKKELAFATRHLALMVKSGVAITRGLEMLAPQASKGFRGILLDVAEHVRQGEPLSGALERHPEFSRLYAFMVRAAEATGNLEEALFLLAQHLEQEVELKNRIRNALLYPAVIVAAMVGIGILMVMLVVPRLAQTFEELGVPLPFSTRLIISVSILLRDWWFLLPLLAGGIVFGGARFLRTEGGRRVFSRLTLATPFVRTLVQKLQIAYFTRTLSSLLKGGVALLEALAIVRETLPNRLYQESMTALAHQVEQGQSLAKAMMGFERLYPPLIQQMVMVGEETGALVEILKHVAEFYEAEVAEFMKSLSTLIEPVLMALIGAAVGFFAVSMVQPMYGLLNAL